MIWRDVVLGEVAEIVMGQSPDGLHYNTRSEGLPLITGSGQLGETHPKPTQYSRVGAKTSEPGDLILSIRASIGDLNWSDKAYYLGRGVAAIRPSSQTDASYLWHTLRYKSWELKSRATGSTFKQVKRDDVAALRLRLPPLSEQRRIAAILDRVEALRAKRRDATIKLDSARFSVFEDMFGDPVLNPKSLPRRTLGELLSFQQYGPRFYNETYVPDGVRIARITDLDEAGNLDFSAMPRLAVSAEDEEKYALRSGDLIFARSGATVGKVALIGPSDPRCVAGAYFITMRFVEAINPLYARAVLMSPSIRAIIKRRSRQAAQQNFSGPGLRELPMPLPPLEFQERFASAVSAIDALKHKLSASALALDQLFDSIQHLAFTGEL